MNARDLAVDVLLAAGVVVTVLSTLAMLAFRTNYDRLHYLAPVTSLGSPLIAVALIVADGWGLTAAQILLIAVLLALTGPAVGLAVARATGQRDRLIERDGPE